MTNFKIKTCTKEHILPYYEKVDTLLRDHSISRERMWNAGVKLLSKSAKVTYFHHIINILCRLEYFTLFVVYEKGNTCQNYFVIFNVLFILCICFIAHEKISIIDFYQYCIFSGKNVI